MDNSEANALVRPLARSVYACDFAWSSLAGTLDEYRDDYGLNLNPDYQRGRVWEPSQKALYIENVFRGVVPPETMVLQWNCPQWEDGTYAGELPREMQIVDGLQRLTTVLDYLKGDVMPFGRGIDDFTGTDFDVRMRVRFRFRFSVHSFSTRQALLQHYLDLNTGGTPHSQKEIQRVHKLLFVARAPQPPAGSSSLYADGWHRATQWAANGGALNVDGPHLAPTETFNGFIDCLAAHRKLGPQPT